MRSFSVHQQPGPIASIDSLLSAITVLRDDIDAERSVDRKLWFRGHSKLCYLLRPTIGRPHRYAGKKRSFSREHESTLLHRFRRRCYAFFDRPISPAEAMFLARQHGLPTRLLDWTANALFALYFVCSENAGKDGRLWAMLPHEETQDVDVFDLVNIKTELEMLERAERNGGQNTCFRSSILRGSSRRRVRILYSLIRGGRSTAIMTSRSRMAN